MTRNRAPQRWFLSQQDRVHLVEIDDSGWSRSITWTVDGAVVATARSMDEKVRLTPEQGADPGAGALGLRFPAFTGPARRVSWYGGTETMGAAAQARLGTGGADFAPEPGSAAAARAAWIRAHPRRYQVRETVLAVLKVVVPLVLMALLGRLVVAVPWPDVDWPDLPGIPWPEVDWPDLPGIPWPEVDWPDWRPPDWLRWVLDHAKYIVPILVAFVLARREVRRRRDHDADGTAPHPSPQERGAQDRAGGRPRPAEPDPTSPLDGDETR